MTVPPDPITAVQAFLRADADLVALLGDAALVTTRKVQKAAAALMPRKQVVIKPVPGPGDRGRVELGLRRVDVWSYGETEFEAAQLDRAVHHALKDLDRRIVSGDALLHDAIFETGPLESVDSELSNAPYHLSTWLIAASEVAVA